MLALEQSVEKRPLGF